MSASLPIEIIEAVAYYWPWIAAGLMPIAIMLAVWFILSGRFDRFIEWACK